MTESWVMENAATSWLGAYRRSVATSSACVCPTPPGVIAKSCDNMCDEATRKTVEEVTGIWNAVMKTTFTPTRQQYEPAEGSATSRV
jgi:hypothetical protein